MDPAVTILLPNYKTPDITRLCLRLLRRHTSAELYRVIAIDNHSEDESVEYLRSLAWIDLIEREPIPGETPSESHVGALDMALERVDTPYVLSIHTDTLVLRDDWLPFLLKQIQRADDIAGVGSWKLEVKSGIRRLVKRTERRYQKIIGREKREERFLRSHCALYRTQQIRALGLGFGMGDTAGKVMHQKLIAAGHQMIFLPAERLIKYMVHINHATMVLNARLGARDRTISRGLNDINRIFDQIDAISILADISLDE